MEGPALDTPSLWSIALSNLPEEQQTALKSGLVLPLRFDDLKATIEIARGHAASKWKVTTRHGEIDFQAKFSRIVSWVQKFIEIGDVAVNYDPGHAALPWAAVRLLLQVMVNNTTRAANFIEGLEQVAFYIYDSAIRENLYVVTQSSEHSNDLRNHILALYAAVLRFLLAARQFFEASPSKRMLSSTTKSADEVVKLLDPIAQQAKLIVTISGRIDSRTLISTQVSMLSLSDSHAKSMDWLRDQVQDNDAIMSSLINSNHQETMSRFDNIEESYDEHDRLKILSWLSAIPYHQHHKKSYSEVLEGTGSWFLEDTQYHQWRESDQSAMLWIHGIPGSGKSKLVSLAIQEALENSHELLPLYFYCSSSAGEPQRARAEDIMRCLVKQFSTSAVGYGAKNIPQYVLEKYKTFEKTAFASGELLFEESCDLISRFAIEQGRVLIMLDALDECNESAKHLLIKAFNNIISSSSAAVVKLLISSRDSPDLATYFEEHQTYEVRVESNRNQQDIDTYVKKQLSVLVSQKRIRLDEGKPPSEKLQQMILTKLCDEAQGMFRWVSLQLDYICTMQKASDVRKRLGKLPNSLSDSYQELYDRRYEEYEPEERKRLDIALSLLLVPHRPTDPSVFTKLVFWDEDDEDDEEDEEQEGKDESWKDGNQTGGDCASSNTGSNLEEYEYHTESDDTQSLEDGDGYENNYDPNRRPFESISRLCFDLVIFDRAIGAFRFAHTSVQDYLCNHNPNFQMMCDSHARIAERCISIILHTIERRGMVFPKLRIRGDQAQTCIHAKDYESSSNQIIDSRAKKESESDVGNGSALRLLDMRPPTCTRVHRKQVDIETLEEYAIPWEWVKASPPYLRGGSDYILVMALITKSHTEFLSRHTHWLRERHQIRGGRRPTDTAIALEGEYEDSVGIDQKRHERSRRSSQSSTGQDLQVPDFWYFDLPPMKERTLLENLSIFVDVYWAYYTANSGVLRYRTSFKELESELQMQFTRQAWEAVRPWVFFSACANGLTNYVNAWTKAHPRLARTTQRFPNERNALLEVCRSDHYQLKIAEILIDQGAEIYHIPGTSPRSPLCMAAGFGHEAVMKLLLEKCPDIINTPGPSGLAPISTAVLQNPPNAVSIVEMLLNHGANANEIADNLNERRPLHAAAINQNRGVLQVLLNSGAYIDAQDDRGFTPLMSSIMEDDYDACRLLIGHGASVDLKDVDGNSLFTVAVLERANPLIAELLLKYDVDIDSRDRFGDSAMHLAAERGRADSAKALIDYGININATNASGRTALHVVAAEGDEEIAKMLIASGADINAIDISGFNALSCAAYMGNIEISLLLVEKTTDINLQSCAGEPPLSLAACTGEEALVNLLLNAGAEVGLQEPGPHCPFIDPEERLSGYCRDPVLAALAKGHVKIAKIIMEFAGGREEGSEYAEALGMLDIDDMDEFERWSTVRRRNAPENRPDVVLFRDDVNIRFKKLLKSNMDRTAAEVGILWEKDWSF